MEQSRRKVQTPSIDKQKTTSFLGQKNPQKQILLKRLSDYSNAIIIRNKKHFKPLPNVKSQKQNGSGEQHTKYTRGNKI